MTENNVGEENSSAMDTKINESNTETNQNGKSHSDGGAEHPKPQNQQQQEKHFKISPVHTHSNCRYTSIFV